MLLFQPMRGEGRNLYTGKFVYRSVGLFVYIFFLILEFKTEVIFVYTRDQNKSEICIQKFKAKEIFVYSISSI